MSRQIKASDFVRRPLEMTVDGVTAEMAGWLVRQPEFRALRTKARGQHPAVHAYLTAVTVVGQEWISSVSGTPVASISEQAPSLRTWVTTREAADLLDLSSTRAVTQAIARKRLKARNEDGRWQIEREDLEHYRAARAA